MKKRNLKKILNFIGAALLVVSTILILPPEPIAAQDVEVEVQTGPAFKDGDGGTAKNCTISALANKFPFDFMGGNVGNGSKCPNIKLFGYDNELCFIVDIYMKIRPAVIASSLIYGIFNW